MNQLTLRGFDDDLSERLQALAEKEHLSLNKAALKLLRQATGLDVVEPPQKRVGSALDEFIGCWTPNEAKDFNRQVKVFEQVDPDLWSYDRHFGEIDGLPWVEPKGDR